MAATNTPSWGDPKITPPEQREPDRKVELNNSVERYRERLAEQAKEPLPF